MKNILIYMVLALTVVLSFSCEECEDPRNPECANYDPCWDFIELDFEMGEDRSDFSNDRYFPTDTVLYGRVYFRANIEDAISYEWRVGTDTRTWDTPSFGLYFDNADSLILRYNPVLVTLVVNRKPNLLCNPDDDGIDSIARYLYFRDYSEAAYFGTWEGYRDNLTNEVYQIEIKRDLSVLYPHDMLYEEYIYNIYNEGVYCYHMLENSIMGYRTLHNNGFTRPWNGEECGSPYAENNWIRNFKMQVNTTENTIHMSWVDWERRENGGGCCDTTSHTFTGRLIH